MRYRQLYLSNVIAFPVKSSVRDYTLSIGLVINSMSSEDHQIKTAFIMQHASYVEVNCY